MQIPTFHDKDKIPEDSHLLEAFSDKDATSSEQEVAFNNDTHSRTPKLRWTKAGSVSLLYLRSTLFFLLPTFVQSRVRPSPPGSSKPLHPTAFLDGMRGLAALFVFFYHLSYSSHDVLTAYGADGSNYEFLKLPFVRFFYTGPAMVAIFYVVSGYALSYKPVRQMRSRDWKGLMHTISSSILRRAIRLYLPCVVSTLMIVLLVRLGVYEWTREIAEDWQRLDHVRETHLQHFDTTAEQLRDWASKMWIFVHPWSFGTKDTDIDIDRHLWTIPMEFRSSLVLYLTQAGLARLKSPLRMTALVALVAWCLFKDRWEMILFYSGFLFAELDFARRAKAAATYALPSQGTPCPAPSRQRAWSAVYVAVFVVGIYLCGQPQVHAEHSPGWATLTALIPSFTERKQRFWVGWGALLLVWSTSNSPRTLQRIFTNGPVQYLGKISFALYLMHGPITHTVGYGAMDVLWRSIGTETVLRKEIGFCIAAAIDIVTTVWVADVFWRAVDLPVVSFAKWLEDKCIVKLED
ncbi:hypothetical protein MBLNU459_g4601t1 [Dothideomycetes sp. NU459]